MKDIKKHLCDEMHKFVKEHIDELENKKTIWGNNQAYEELGFKDRKDMLRQIKNDPEVAFWALTDLCVWGMSRDYCRELFIEKETDDILVYKIGERFFVGNYASTKEQDIKEVRPIKKSIVVYEWEEVK